MRRRTLLAGVATGTLSLAGCLSGGVGTPDESPEGSPDGTDTPRAVDCPTSQELGVAWPSELDADAVESFVESYEAVYYRDVVVAYESETRLDSYELDGSVSEGPTRRGDGWVCTYRGGGGVYTPTLALGATPAEPPDGVDPVPLDAVETDRLSGLLVTAAEDGEAEDHVDRRDDVQRFLDELDALAGRLDLDGRGDEDTVHFDVDGTVVALTVQATSFHGDYGWTARYYVDEQVVRRVGGVGTDEDTDPREGELLECRESA